MKSTLSTLVATSTLALLGACGGGGGGDSTPTPSGAPVAITSTNQSDVARASVNGGLAVSLAQGALGSGSTPTSVTGRSHALAVAMQRALQAATGRKGVAGASAHPLATTVDTNACDVSGTMTTSFNDKDGNSQLSSGDVLTATFAQCKESATLSVSGVVVVTITATPTDTQFLANAQFQSLAVQDSGVTTTLSGAVAISETDSDTQSNTTIAVATGGLNATIVSSGYNDTVAFESGMVFTTSVVDASATFSVAMAGTFSATSIGGRVTIATPVPLTQGFTDAYPSHGQVRLTGASGSTLLATVLSATQVELKLDANGDGTFESDTTVAWSTLIP